MDAFPQAGAERPVYVVAPGGRTATGGMARMVDYFMSAWEAEKRRPSLVLVDSSGPYVKWRMPLHFAAALTRVAANGARGRIGLLHIHAAERGSVLRKGTLIRLGRALGIPVVVHMHSADFMEFYEGLHPALQAAVRDTFRCADRFIVLGETWRRFFVERVGLDPARVLVVHNAVPGPPSLPAKPDGPCRMVFAGVLSERKGLKELLDALADPRLRDADWTLDVAGNGDQAPFRAQAEAHGIAGRAVFHGWMDSAGVRRLLKTAHVMVLPSRNEGLPMIVIEAMAYGAAVVSTPVGSIRDAVEDGVTGLLVPPRNTAALADALASLVASPARCRRMGEAGRARWARDFEISRLNGRLAAVFAALMQPRADAAAKAVRP